MNTLVAIFIVVTAVAVVVQMGVLLALYANVRKSSDRIENLANALEAKGLPLLDAARDLLQDTGPKLKMVTAHLVEVSAGAKAQMGRLDATLSDIVDRTRLQVIRTDELVSRTLDRVEETTELVQHTVISPVRRVSAIVGGVLAAVDTLLGSRRSSERSAPARRGNVRDDEELFI